MRIVFAGNEDYRLVLDTAHCDVPGVARLSFEEWEDGKWVAKESLNYWFSHNDGLKMVKALALIQEHVT